MLNAERLLGNFAAGENVGFPVLDEHYEQKLNGLKDCSPCEVQDKKDWLSTKSRFSNKAVKG